MVPVLPTDFVSLLYAGSNVPSQIMPLLFTLPLIVPASNSAFSSIVRATSVPSSSSVSLNFPFFRLNFGVWYLIATHSQADASSLSGHLGCPLFNSISMISSAASFSCSSVDSNGLWLFPVSANAGIGRALVIIPTAKTALTSRCPILLFITTNLLFTLNIK